MKQGVIGSIVGVIAGLVVAPAVIGVAGEDVATTGTAMDGVPACTKPAYLLVIVDDFAPERSAGYARALRETGIVARHGGQYVAVGRPARVMEGEWPESRAFVLERYPCLEALNRFWDSDAYQNDVKPLRADSGDYTIVAFESVGADRD